jgi:hypothetical protein
MKARVREFLHATPFRPFVIKMADGREYRVEFPDSVLASPSSWPQIIIEDSTKDALHYLSVLLISSVEVEKKEDARAASKAS